MRTQKVLVVILACLVSGDASAGLCEMQLQEEANVFEVNCFLDLSRCHVAGYFTHPRLSPGHNGLVASLSKAPPKKEDDTIHTPMLVINTYRNGTARVKTPPGYWAAMQVAEQILMEERKNELHYFDAITGTPVVRPKMECLPYKK